MTSDNANSILLGSDAVIAIHFGAKLRMSSSLVTSKVYTVDHISLNRKTLILTENFEGSSTAAVSLYLMRGGSPQFDVQITRKGFDEFVYDIFFIGAHWNNVPQIQAKLGAGGTERVCAIIAP